MLIEKRKEQERREAERHARAERRADRERRRTAAEAYDRQHEDYFLRHHHYHRTHEEDPVYFLTRISTAKDRTSTCQKFERNNSRLIRLSKTNVESRDSDFSPNRAFEDDGRERIYNHIGEFFPSPYVPTRTIHKEGNQSIKTTQPVYFSSTSSVGPTVNFSGKDSTFVLSRSQSMTSFDNIDSASSNTSLKDIREQTCPTYHLQFGSLPNITANTSNRPQTQGASLLSKNKSPKALQSRNHFPSLIDCATDRVKMVELNVNETFVNSLEKKLFGFS
jgi:hypothetical protein